MNEEAKKFIERQAYWTSRGLSGRAVFERLAIDTILPVNFTENATADIAGLSPHTLRQRRHRGQEPSFIRYSSRCVRYPREAICKWMADRLHMREAA